MRVLLFGWAGGEATLLVRARIQGQRTGRDWTYCAIVATVGGAIAAAFPLSRVHSADLGGGLWPVGAGLALLALGASLRLWSMVTLGRFFTFRVAIQDEHRVIDTGPYRFVRLPSYSGLLVACLGLGIAFANWLSLAVLVVLPLAGILVRIRIEERALTAALGDRYRRYAAGRARLVPGVW